jgi:hypothetical protein
VYLLMVYTVHVSTATELRKNLFQELEKAADGETVWFTFKGLRMRIDLDPAQAKTSKLARLVAHPEALADPDVDLIHWNDGFAAEWESKWGQSLAGDGAKPPRAK